MSLEYREALMASRKSAENELKDYRETLAGIPEDIKGVRARILSLRIHPLKALAGSREASLKIGKDGLETIDGFKDRMAMLALRKPGECNDVKFDFVRFSQRNAPQLSLIKAGGRQFGTMDYIAPDDTKFTLKAEDLHGKSGEPVLTRMFDDGELVSGVVENGSVTEWIRDFLKKWPSRNGSFNPDEVEVIVRNSDFERQVEERHRRGDHSRILYSDGGQLLITSKSTLDWLNKGLLKEHGYDRREVFQGSFRPNIVLDQILTNLEDLVDSAEIGDLRLKFGEMCVRCPVPNIDPENAQVTAEPGKWLTKNRPRRPDTPKATFGVIAEIDPSSVMQSELSVGDDMEITGEKDCL